MMMRKKEEQSLKRRRKDIDIINDNDDIIAGLIGDMKHAAEVILQHYLGQTVLISYSYGSCIVIIFD